jgi:lantibiotic modifying enzyme
MSHGAAGYAYALASLAVATGRKDFAAAAAECIAFEDSTYDAEHANWPDFRPDDGPRFPCQWCHGAPGIGLSRIAMSKLGVWDAKADTILRADRLATDIGNALAAVERAWPGHVDTMCCGTLGSIEFFSEAGNALSRSDLRHTTARRLMAVLETASSTGGYRWNVGSRQVNLGLFRGLAGVGYTCLRQADRSLPNILIWE